MVHVSEQDKSTVFNLSGHGIITQSKKTRARKLARVFLFLQP